MKLLAEALRRIYTIDVPKNTISVVVKSDTEPEVDMLQIIMKVSLVFCTVMVRFSRNVCMVEVKFITMGLFDVDVIRSVSIFKFMIIDSIAKIISIVDWIFLQPKNFILQVIDLKHLYLIFLPCDLCTLLVLESCKS